MPSRPHQKLQPGVPNESEFTFHLVSKQTVTGGANVIAGAIVTGPVASLFDDALGSAFGDSSKVTSAEADSLKSASKKEGAEPKSKRRHPPARAARKTE